MHKLGWVYISFLLLAFSPGAYAYVGPGLGLGVLGTLLGIIFAILLAIIGMVWYPVKALLKKRKAPAASQSESR